MSNKLQYPHQHHPPPLTLVWPLGKLQKTRGSPKTNGWWEHNIIISSSRKPLLITHWNWLLSWLVVVLCIKQTLDDHFVSSFSRATFSLVATFHPVQVNSTFNIFYWRVVWQLAVCQKKQAKTKSSTKKLNCKKPLKRVFQGSLNQRSLTDRESHWCDCGQNCIH